MDEVPSETDAVEDNFGARVDYAKLVKEFGAEGVRGIEGRGADREGGTQGAELARVATH